MVIIRSMITGFKGRGEVREDEHKIETLWFSLEEIISDPSEGS